MELNQDAVLAPAATGTNTRHFMHITALGAMEPALQVDDRARIGVVPGTPENVVVLSNALAAEVGAGGPCFEDVTSLLRTAPGDLRNCPGIRACAR